MKRLKKSLVSTLICTYNAEKFFRPTIESVIDQTYRNQEILIWDDGSNDKTIDIIKNYQEKDKRIKLWTSKELGKQLGPYGGLNFLIDKSNGEFIAIQDHDDIWHTEKLERQVNFLNKNLEYIGVGTKGATYYMKENIIIISNFLGKNNFCFHTSLMFRNNGYKYDITKYLPDEDFMKNKINKVYIINILGLIWRRLPNLNNLSFKRIKKNNLTNNLKNNLTFILHKNKYILCFYTKIKNVLFKNNTFECYYLNNFLKKYPIFKKYLK